MEEEKGKRRVLPWMLVAVLALLLLLTAGVAVFFGLRWSSARNSASRTQARLAKTERELKQLKTQEQKVIEKVVEKTPTVPDWVPLYPGFEWTLPFSASITGQKDEHGEGFDWGVMSNRRNISPSAQIWQWYRDQLQPQGWDCMSGSAGGGAHWGYRCWKGDRSILVLSSAFGEPGTDGIAENHPSGLYLRVYWRE